MQNARLNEAQARIKIAGGNINNLRYADDTPLMAKSEEELKNLLIRVKKSEKVALKLNIQKTKIIALTKMDKKINSFIVSTFPPSICHELMGPDAMILVF